VYTAGIADEATQIYESSLSTSGLLPFPGGKQYYLIHHLGFTPASVEYLIGFSSSGEAVTNCAGNTCIERCVNDELIWIQNDTCADFFLRVVASKKSLTQQGALCPGGVKISLGGATDASIASSPDAATEPARAPPDGTFTEAMLAE
jgi:hypothetical protein